MDLLASILAYLGTVTTIIVAVAMSYEAIIYAPSHAPGQHHSLMLAITPSTAKLDASKPAVKPTTTLVRLDSGAAEPVRGGATNITAAAPAEAAAKRRAARKRAVMAQQRLRWLARQARDRQWAYQQAPQAFGYADERPTDFRFYGYQ